jgi:hypothetical protein
MVATTRFRVPFTFPLAVSAGVGVHRLHRGLITRRDLAAIAVALLVLGTSAVRPLFWTIFSGRFASVAELRDTGWRWFRY